MTSIYDLFDKELFLDMLSDGYVTARDHPELPYVILNYTDKATYDRTWNEVTRQCRGLIFHRDTNEIIARPFRKFFNHGEPAAADLDTSGPCCVTDKMDGSLGILYPTGGGKHAIATRGSFLSQQAAHATEVYRARYERHWQPSPWLTYLFEIVYPGNRIVVNYGDTDDLVLLATVVTATGASFTGQLHNSDWPGPHAEEFPFDSLGDALAAPPRPGKEGLVVHFLDTDERLKIKQEDYVYLHRILTGLTVRRVWERLAICAVIRSAPDMIMKHVARALRMDVSEAAAFVRAGESWFEEVRQVVPEEFMGWFDATVQRLIDQAASVAAEAQAAFDAVRNLPRREAAISLEGSPYRSMVFAAMDGKPIAAQVWMAIYPEHETPAFNRSEDVA